MSEPEKTQFNPRDRQVLYDFWNKLPPIKLVKDAEKIYYAHTVRILILKSLGEGLSEASERPDSQKIIRRALSAQEIYQRVQHYKEIKRQIDGVDWKDFEVSLNNLYFHIQKMEEANLIQTIAILREGRHNVSYYGRTAQVLVFRIDYEEYEKVKNAFSAMVEITPHMDSDLDPQKIQEFYQRYISIGQNYTKKLFENLTHYEEALKITAVDPGDILNFLELLHTVSPEYIELLKEMTDYLDLQL